MSNFDLSALALAATCPNNELLYDDTGMPSVMVKIPRLTYAQLGMGDSDAVHPAFIVNDQEVDAIWISKYQNIVENSRAYSLPGQDPTVNIDFDTARQVCHKKGSGWHLMTRMEWGLLMQWCENNGFIPLGNNNYGKHVTEISYKGIPTLYDASNDRINRVATGTGPLTWYHDNSPAGIADLCGNVWEWMGGIRTVYGELQILPNNDGADKDNSQASDSPMWRAISSSSGTFVSPDGNGTTSGTLKMDWANSCLTYSTTVTDPSTADHASTLGSIVTGAAVGDNTKRFLQSLGMLLYPEKNLCASHFLSFNPGQQQRLFCSGGNWINSTYNLASFYGCASPSYSSNTIGFRSAFVELP